jgi:hypothetical protein
MDVNPDYVTIAYSNRGVPLWTNRYNGALNGEDVAVAVAVDGCGNVVVTGRSIRAAWAYEYATVCYSHSGLPLWTNLYTGPANGDNQPETKSSLAVSADGAVYVVGGSDGDYSGSKTYDFAIVKYPPTLSSIPLTIARDGAYVVLSWGCPLFGLEAAPSVSGPYTNVPAASSPFTNTLPNETRFFRLRSN